MATGVVGSHTEYASKSKPRGVCGFNLCKQNRRLVSLVRAEGRLSLRGADLGYEGLVKQPSSTSLACPKNEAPSLEFMAYARAG